MTPPPPRHGQSGLTLVEMLVALVLFALIGLAGLAVLNTVLRVNAGTEGRLERLAQIDRALSLVSRDLQQVAPSAIVVSADEVRFTRRLATGDAALRYVLRDDRLLRIWPAGGADAPVEQQMLDNLRGVDWQALDAERTWQATWPPDDAEAPPPLALRMTLRLAESEGDAPWTVTRTVELPARAPQ
ncbi:type II secretion system protein GspJ [Sulfitobacter sabulilitoris]|uniref:Type II secretion system protein J n=1 Tax=Sulfitobacter sabulilitoris TaxID=2562655 RepID=A0A5S3PF98_9RHOB|nr:type II secretion system protein GspJ [Sulfitobacter sabulilitoris]TMM51790.1 prepilin-type N-terminal cleavage/methylation domain-containing protein [Sulfitobacter sabulilitoris]